MEYRWMLRSGLFEPVQSSLQGGTPSRFTLWGIVNCTPDSFYDGGLHDKPGEATSHALLLHSQGARVLDIGGASSRPGAPDTPEEVESERILPVLRSLHERRLATQDLSYLLSADTWRAGTAAMALGAGADIINDVTACSRDAGLVDVLAQYRPGYVLTHCAKGAGTPLASQSPRYADIIDHVRSFFESEMHRLTDAGLPEDHIILDPGIGFGKNPADSSRILARIRELFTLGRPLLLGVSNKSLFGDLLGLGLDRRVPATSVATSLLAARGVFHHRVHDVAAARDALRIAELFTEWEHQ